MTNACPGMYRYGFNGKEKDDEVNGSGVTYDYGFRIYDSRVAKFLSVDPLTKSYPMLTPYQFASNRPIDGIDLDGLEYLRADKARVEFKYGGLQLKVENFIWLNRNTFNNANSNPACWQPGEIGISKKVADVNIIAPQPNDPQASDVEDNPTQDMRMFNPEEGVKSEPYNRAGRREIERKGPMVSAPGKTTLAKGLAVLDVINLAAQEYISRAQMYDINKVKEHTQIAEKVTIDITNALNEGLIPEKYQNQNDIVNIMNVVLQGVNNTDNKEIYDIGMKIYGHYNAPLQTITVPSKMDNIPSKTYVVPKGVTEIQQNK